MGEPVTTTAALAPSTKNALAAGSHGGGGDFNTTGNTELVLASISAQTNVQPPANPKSSAEPTVVQNTGLAAETQGEWTSCYLALRRPRLPKINA